MIRHVREGFLKGIHVYIVITNHSSGSKCNAGTGDKHTVDSSPASLTKRDPPSCSTMKPQDLIIGDLFKNKQGPTTSGLTLKVQALKNPIQPLKTMHACDLAKKAE